MLRAFFTATCFTFALLLLVGCGGQGSDGGGPRIANPNDPKAKELKPMIPGGGGAKQPGPQ
jgi:hypothetical protein